MGQAAFLLVAGAVLSRIFGFIRETVIAYQFGATAQADAFLVASVVPMALAGIVAGAVAAATLLFILAAPVLVPLIGPGLAPETKTLAVSVRITGPGINLHRARGTGNSRAKRLPALYLSRLCRPLV